MFQDFRLVQNGYLLKLHTDTKVFADETDKYHFLRSLRYLFPRSGFHAIAFTLLDQEFYCLVYGHAGGGLMLREHRLGEKVEDQDALKSMLQTFFENTFLPSYQRKPSEKREIPLDIRCSLVEGSGNLTRIAEELHFLAEKNGLVGNAHDYFWSSIQNYANRYQWEFVDSGWAAGSLVIPRTSGKKTGKKTGQKTGKKTEKKAGQKTGKKKEKKTAKQTGKEPDL